MMAKTFYKALGLISTDVEAAKAFLKDRRLTSHEKLILESYFDLRANKYEKIISHLSKIQIDDGFVESQRLLVLGCAYNNSGDFINAVTFLNLAVKASKSYPQNPRMFTILYTLFVLYLNIQDVEGMKNTFSILEDYQDMTQDQLIILHDCRLQFDLVTKNYKDAQIMIVKLDKVQEKMSPSQIINYLMAKFDFYIAQSDFTHAYRVLDDLKMRRNFRTSANFTFMKGLLDHYTQKQPLYLYAKDFEDQVYLLHQVNVLLALDKGDKEAALNSWNELRKINPAIFGKDLSYTGFKCVFSLCLEKYNFTPATQINRPVSSNKEEQLYQILQEAKGPISKEVLYEIIYLKPLESKDELFKLTSLIYQLKKKKDIKIKTQKGAYLLVA